MIKEKRENNVCLSRYHQDFFQHFRYGRKSSQVIITLKLLINASVTHIATSYLEYQRCVTKLLPKTDWCMKLTFKRKKSKKKIFQLLRHILKLSSALWATWLVMVKVFVESLVTSTVWTPENNLCLWRLFSYLFFFLGVVLWQELLLSSCN